jgi:hypothetical protein
MADERRTWARDADPGTHLGLVLGTPVSDDEIDQLRGLAASGTAEAVPDRQFTVNRTAEIFGFPPAVLEDPPGRYHLHPEISDFAVAVLEKEHSRRQAARCKEHLAAALAQVPEPHYRLLVDLCAPPRPLESAIRGRDIGNPESFVSAVNNAARSQGINEPLVEASGWTVRATAPPDMLVGAVLQRQKREYERRQRDRLAEFMAGLGPDETALLRHLAGFEVVDEATLRRLDPTGDALNERARSESLTGDPDFPALLRRDDHDRWRVHPSTLARLRDLLRETRQ